MTSKISIIMSTYNRPERLKKAIQSVIDQTYSDWELIIVADGLKDPASSIIPQDPRIRYIEIEHFGNDTKPKNTGIMASCGEYIAFLDDDNTYRPDHLQLLVNELDNSPKVDMVYGLRWVNFEDGQPGRIGVSSEYKPGLLGSRNYIDTSDVLARRASLFDVGGFDERYKKYVDWNMWWRMEKYGFTFKHIPIIITDYNVHKDMKSLTVKDRQPDGSPSVPLGAAPVFLPEWDAVECEVCLPYLGQEVKEPKVAIYSITYDRLDYTKKCFESLYKTAGYPFDHFVIDNGSTDGTVEYLKEHSGNLQWCIFNDKNVGISVASNQALDLIGNKYDIIVKVDNDCLFLTPDWLATMVKIWKSNHKIALSCYIQGLKDNPGGAPREFYGHICNEQVGFTSHLGGICHFVSSRAYQDFRWDEDSFLHGIQDVELSRYLLSKGYAMAYLENFFAEHYEGTDGQHTRYPDYFERRKIEKITKYEKNS